MSTAVLFDKVNYSDLLDDFSFKINIGTRVLVITASEEESFLLAGLMIGLTPLDSGSINISGCSVSESNQEVLLQLRSKIGIVPSVGGLVSNLKVWENIFLPYLYHFGKPTPLDEDIAENYLKELNYTGRRMVLPAHLTLYEKRVVAFIRSAVMNPDLMLYCNTLEKLSPQQQTGLSNVINRFHSESFTRTSIFFASSADAISTYEFDTVISVHR